MAAVRWLRWGGAAVVSLAGRLGGSVLRVRVWSLVFGGVKDRRSEALRRRAVSQASDARDPRGFLK